MADQPQKTVFLLDDDPGILRLCLRVLERAGLAVITAQNTAVARELLSNRRDQVDLIVLDYQLGSAEPNGLDFFRSLQKDGLAKPAVLATGFSDEGRVLEALRAGVRDVVRKADDFLEHLPRTVVRVLREVDAERKVMEAEAVRESEQRLRLALETGRLGSWEMDPASPAVECSAVFKSHFGLSTDATVNADQLYFSIVPEDRERVREEFRRVADQQVPADIEFRTVMPDGSFRSIVARGRVADVGPRRGKRLIGVTMDLTAARQAEQDLRVAKDSAEAANKAKDHFLAVLSHELRTPLTPLLVTAHEMANDATLPARAREAFAMIRRNVELETKLVDDLLDLTKISRGKLALSPRPTDLHQIIRNVVRMCEGELHGKAIRLRLELNASMQCIMADSARLQQILWNLLKNAVKFTPDYGMVAVRTEDVGNRQVRIEVADTGIGIDEELLPRVFEAFEQGENAVTRQFGGLGLGLAITKALVHMHGGTICAVSPGRGQGATFTVELPAITESATQTPAATDQHPAPKARGLSILLVEDHPDTAAALARLLKIYGHNVRTADSVASALQAVEAHPFDLLVSDIGLPDGTGLDLMRQLRSKHDLKGIVLSGFGMEEDVRRSREAGFMIHLTKPINPDDLQAEIIRLTSTS